MDNNNFDISNITDIQGGTYNFTNGTMTLIDQDGQEIDFIISKMDDRVEYAIKYNDIEVGLLNPQTQKIIFEDTEIPMYFMLQDNQNTNYIIKPEDLNIATFNYNEKGYCTITDNNGNVIGLFAASEKNPDGSYDLLYNIGDTNPKATYNPETKEIKIMHSDGVGYNSVSLAQVTNNSTTYVNLQQLDITSLSYNTNSTPPTVTLNGYEFELEPISGQSNQYKIAGLEGTLFNPTTGQIQLLGQNQPTYFATYGDNNTFYSLEGIIPNVNNATSVIVNLNNNPKTITIDGIPYNLQSVTEGSSIYYIQDQTNDNNLAIYDDSTKQIISAGKDVNGQNNSIDLDNDSRFVQTTDGMFKNINSITDIQGGTYNFTNGTMTLIDQDGQEIDFIISKMDDRVEYAIKYNDIEVGLLNPQTQKIIFEDTEIPMYFMLQDNQNTNYIIKPEDLNIATFNYNEKGYCTITDNNGNVIGLFAASEKNPDGSYDLLYNIGDTNPKATYNPDTKEIKIMHSDGDGYDIHKEINGTFYKLTSPTLSGLQNINSVTLSINSTTNTGTFMLGNNSYSLQPVTSVAGNTMYGVINADGVNVAIYNDLKKQIVSAGSENSANLAQTTDNTTYVNLEKLDVTSLEYDLDSTPPTITLNGYEFDLRQEGSTYRLDKYPQSYFDPRYVQLRLGPSEDNEYFYLQFKDIENNDMFYKFNIRNAIVPDLEEVTYISVDIDNLTLNTSEQEYTLEQIDNTDMYFLKFIKADGDGRMIERCSGIYDKSSGKIIGIGNNNVLNFNNCALTANGTYCPLSGYMSESDMENIKLVTINGNNISITIDNDEPLNYTLVPVTTEENNTIYYIQKANGENIAIYDSGEKQIVSVGSENKVDFNNNSQFALAINEDAEIYVDLSKLDITSLSYNTTSTPQTITLNGYTFELTDYDSITGNYKIAGIDGTVFNPLTSQITIPNGESFRFVCDQNNIGNFYKFSDDLLKCDEIDMVVFSQKLGTSIYNGATINNDATYDFVDYPDPEKNYLKLLKNNQGEIVCGYDFSSNSIFEIDNGIFDISSNDKLYLNESLIQGYKEFVIEVNSLSWSLDSFQPKLTINGRDFNLYDYNIDNDGNYKIYGALPGTTFNPDTLQITNSNNETFKFTIYDGKAYTSPVNEDGIAQYVFEPYNGEVYKLSNPPLQDLNNIYSMDINGSNIRIMIVGPNTLNGTLVPARTEGDNTIYYIQDLDGNNLAIYDNNAHKIISANSESLTLAQNINRDNRYVNLDHIDINSLSYDTNSTPPTITLNGRKFNLTNYDSETGNYQIAGVEGTLFNSVTSQIKLPGQNQPTYFTVDSKNDFYALDGSIDNINNIFSITIDGNNVSIMMLGNDEPLNCTLVRKPVPFTCRYIQDQDGNKIAIWDPGRRQIITVGSENFANLAHSVGPNGNNIYINLQHLDINSLSYKTDPIYIYPDITLNGYEIDLTDYNQETGEYKIAGFEGTLFNPTTGQIQLPGQTQATYFAIDRNNNFYALEGKMDDINEINLVTLNIDNDTNTRTITIDGTEYNLQSIEGSNGIYYIQNNDVNVAIYDSNAKQIVSAGSGNLANVIQPIDNTVYINLQTLDINSLEYYYGSSAYNPVWIKLNGYKFNLESITHNYYPYLHYHTIPGAEGVVFKPESGQIQLPGQEETYFATDINNNFYALAGKIDTNNITSVTIDNNNISITIGNNEPSTYALVSTTTAEDNTIYYIQNAEGKNVAIYDDNTKQIISAGRDNSINLNNTFTLSNGVYTRNPQNTPEHTPATTDMNGPDDDVGGTPNRLFHFARPSITTSVTATPPNITPDMTVQDNNVVFNTELENLNVQSMSIVYDEFNLPVSINLNDNNYSLEFNPNTGKYYIANSTTSTLDTSTGTVTLSENNVFKYLSIDSNQYYILSANALDASEILTYNVSVDINSVMVTNINGTTTPYNLVGEENNIKYLVNPNNPTEKLAVFNVSTGEIIYAGQNYISLPQDMIMPDMAVLPSNNMINNNINSDINSNNNDNNIISDDTKQALSDLLRNNNNTIKGYIADGNLEGLKEYLNNEIQNTLPGTENQEIASLAQQVINDMQLEGTKTYEDFIEKLNQSLELNNLPTLDVGLEALENLTDSGTININVNGMNTGSMVTYILIASVATGLTSLAVNRINNKLQKKDLEKDLKKMNKRLEVRRRESLAKNSDGKKTR